MCACVVFCGLSFMTYTEPKALRVVSVLLFMTHTELMDLHVCVRGLSFMTHTELMDLHVVSGLSFMTHTELMDLHVCVRGVLWSVIHDIH